MKRSLDRAMFEAWLAQAGAQVEATTNSYELVRFRARGGVHIVYRKQNGTVTANGFARECVQSFVNCSHPPTMGFTKRPRNGGDKIRAALLERDGSRCFFCGHDMQEGDRTIEHLVSVQNGGPSHLDNLALAHKQCNNLAANLQLIRKIELREQMRLRKSAEMAA